MQAKTVLRRTPVTKRPPKSKEETSGTATSEEGVSREEPRPTETIKEETTKREGPPSGGRTITRKSATPRERVTKISTETKRPSTETPPRKKVKPQKSRRETAIEHWSVLEQEEIVRRSTDSNESSAVFLEAKTYGYDESPKELALLLQKQEGPNSVKLTHEVLDGMFQGIGERQARDHEDSQREIDTGDILTESNYFYFVRGVATVNPQLEVPPPTELASNKGIRALQERAITEGATVGGHLAEIPATYWTNQEERLLHLAVTTGNERSVQFLIDKVVKVDPELIREAARSNYKILELLLQHEAGVESSGEGVGTEKVTTLAESMALEGLATVGNVENLERFRQEFQITTLPPAEFAGTADMMTYLTQGFTPEQYTELYKHLVALDKAPQIILLDQIALENIKNFPYSKVVFPKAPSTGLLEFLFEKKVHPKVITDKLLHNEDRSTLSWYLQFLIQGAENGDEMAIDDLWNLEFTPKKGKNALLSFVLATDFLYRFPQLFQYLDYNGGEDIELFRAALNNCGRASPNYAAIIESAIDVLKKNKRYAYRKVLQEEVPHLSERCQELLKDVADVSPYLPKRKKRVVSSSEETTTSEETVTEETTETTEESSSFSSAGGVFERPYRSSEEEEPYVFKVSKPELGLCEGGVCGEKKKVKRGRR